MNLIFYLFLKIATLYYMGLRFRVDLAIKIQCYFLWLILYHNNFAPLK